MKLGTLINYAENNDDNNEFTRFDFDNCHLGNFSPKVKYSLDKCTVFINFGTKFA